MDLPRRVIHHGLELRFDRASNRRARAVLRQLSSEGRATLTPRLRRQASAYAREVLGSPGFAPWLSVFAAVRGELVEGLIPENFLGRVVLPNVNQRLRFVGDPKSFMKAVFDHPSIPDVAYLVQGSFLDAEMRPVTGEREVRETVFRHGATAVVKADVTHGGRGTEVLHADRFDARELAARIPNGVLQRRVVQHPSFSELGSGAGATLRISTYVTRTGSIRASVSSVQFSARGAETYLASAGLRLLVDAAHGTYRSLGTRGTNMVTFDRVPGGFPPMGGQPVPGFTAARDLVLSLHRRVPHLGVIGWDMMIDGEERPWLLEWNTRDPGAASTETLFGPSWPDVDWSSLRPVPHTWLL